MAGMAAGQSKEGMKVSFGNVQSIGNKVDELRATVSIIKPDVMAITETWAHSGIGNEVMNIEGYEIVTRHDRNDTDRGRGGGIIIYARNDMRKIRNKQFKKVIF